MKRARVLFAIFGAAIAAAGCRGVIGYEDLKLDVDGGDDGNPPGPPPGPDGGSPPPRDSGTPPGDSGAKTDAAPPGDGCNQKTNFGDCMGCCRSAYTSQFPTIMQKAQNVCFCGGHGCETECGSWCTTPSGPPPQSCGACLDQKLNTCTALVSECQSSGCTQALSCVQQECHL